MTRWLLALPIALIGCGGGAPPPYHVKTAAEEQAEHEAYEKSFAALVATSNKRMADYFRNSMMTELRDARAGCRGSQPAIMRSCTWLRGHSLAAACYTQAWSCGAYQSLCEGNPAECHDVEADTHATDAPVVNEAAERDDP